MSSFSSIHDDSALQEITVFNGARDSIIPQLRLDEVRKRSQRFHQEMLDGPKVRFYKSCELVRVPYPMRYAFANVYTQSMLHTPIIHIINRLFIIQVDSADGVKTLLFSPSDIMANAETRFFKRFGGGVFNDIGGNWGK